MTLPSKTFPKNQEFFLEGRRKVLLLSPAGRVQAGVPLSSELPARGYLQLLAKF